MINILMFNVSEIDVMIRRNMAQRRSREGHIDVKLTNKILSSTFVLKIGSGNDARRISFYYYETYL